jgi:hypothetical protein
VYQLWSPSGRHCRLLYWQCKFKLSSFSSSTSVQRRGRVYASVYVTDFHLLASQYLSSYSILIKLSLLRRTIAPYIHLLIFLSDLFTCFRHPSYGRGARPNSRAESEVFTHSRGPVRRSEFQYIILVRLTRSCLCRPVLVLHEEGHHLVICRRVTTVHGVSPFLRFLLARRMRARLAVGGSCTRMGI